MSKSDSKNEVFTEVLQSETISLLTPYPPQTYHPKFWHPYGKARVTWKITWAPRALLNLIFNFWLSFSIFQLRHETDVDETATAMMRYPECPDCTPNILNTLPSPVPICNTEDSGEGKRQDRGRGHLLPLSDAPILLHVGLEELLIKQRNL